MILTDFSQLCIANVVQFQEDFAKGVEPGKAINLLRHSVLSTLLAHKRAYGQAYGGLVIATDGNAYWRRDYFPYYKHSRKKGREDSNLDWDVIFKVMKQFRLEFQEVFHYPVINVPAAEADDVIAVMCEYSQENELKQGGLLEGEVPQPMIILSSDGDFKQLQVYDNVRQWSPLLKKFVTVRKEELELEIMTKIIKGDTGDGVPNIYSPDNHFTLDPTPRQKSVMAPRLASFVMKGMSECANDEERKNFTRNKTLVDFRCIPEAVKDDIIADYIAKKHLKADRMRILNYFNQHKMRQLVDSIEDF
jgi:hypothetical protein